jgi:uncharacterized protein (TIGR00730 family)
MQFENNETNNLKAYEDLDFVKHEACRPIRLQLEYLKPNIVMEENHIDNTLVIMGSARTRPPEVAKRELHEAELKLAEFPDSRCLQQHVYAAKRMVEESKYYQLAQDFARLVSEKAKEDQNMNFVVITGGGGGIMEAGNRGAHNAGAESIGLNISLPFEQKPNDYITKGLFFNFHYFSMRKMHFLLRAMALCAFPGGFGTMDEVFETLTLIQTGKIDPIPVLLFGREFWEEVINWEAFVDRCLISPEDLEIFHFCETAEEAWEKITNFWSNAASEKLVHGPSDNVQTHTDAVNTELCPKDDETENT